MAGVVLVTGGAGFLGVRLARLLADAGERVVLLDRAFPKDTGFEQREGDVTDRAGLWRTIEELRPDGIVHLAAILSGQSESDPARAFDINVGGTVNVLEGARRNGVRPRGRSLCRRR